MIVTAVSLLDYVMLRLWSTERRFSAGAASVYIQSIH